MELNPWYGYSLVLDQDLLGGDGYSLVLAGIIGTMIIRAPHGGRSRKIPVVDHRKGKWEILYVSLVSMSMVIPIIAMASTVLAFADFRAGNGREAPGHPGNVEADDISRRETRPISGRRAGDTISKRELDVASVVNETPGGKWATLQHVIS